MRNTLLALALALAGAGAVVLAADGQGPVDPGPIKIEDANLGIHWFGPEISHKDLRGKVVLFEIYGS